MPSQGWEQGAGGDMTSNDTTVSGRPAYLRVTHASLVDSDQARAGMQKFLGLLTRIWEPCGLRLVVAYDPDDGLRAGFEIRAVTDAEAIRLARAVQFCASRVVPWLGLAAPSVDAPWEESLSPDYVFVTAENPTDT